MRCAAFLLMEVKNFERSHLLPGQPGFQSRSGLTSKCQTPITRAGIRAAEPTGMVVKHNMQRRRYRCDRTAITSTRSRYPGVPMTTLKSYILDDAATVE